MKKSETFLLNGADPRIGKNSFGQNTFHILASSCTSADWSKFMSLAVDKVSFNISVFILLSILL